MKEQNIAFHDVKKAEVKNKEEKNKKRKIFPYVIIVLFMAIAAVFTVMNYNIHVNVYEEMFTSPPESKALVSMVKPLILDNAVTMDNETINKLIAYEVETNIESYVKLDGISIDGVSILFTGENTAVLYIKFTDNSTKVISANLKISFDSKSQHLIAEVSDVSVGRLSLPDFIWMRLLSELKTGEQLQISGKQIIMPLSLSDGENKEYIPKITGFHIKDGKLNIKIENVFGKQFDVLYNILGDKAKTVIETVVDTVINSDNSSKPYRLLYKCVRELSEKFGD